MAENPLVSIVVVTFNQVAYLKECLESCLAQTYQNFEIIVADDCSTDGTKEYLKTLAAREASIQIVFSDQNHGITENCNRGLRMARGEWTKIIAGDDRLTEACIGELVAEAVGSAHSVWFCDLAVFNDQGLTGHVMKQPEWFFPLSSKEQLECLLYKNPPNAPGAFIQTSALRGVGFCDRRFEMMEDYPLWFRLVEAGFSFGYLPRALVGYRESAGGVSQAGQKIGNLRYIYSLQKFHQLMIWPRLDHSMGLKVLDDWIKLKQKEIGIRFLGNRQGLAFIIFKAVTRPLRLYSLYRSIKKAVVGKQLY